MMTTIEGSAQNSNSERPIFKENGLIVYPQKITPVMAEERGNKVYAGIWEGIPVIDLHSFGHWELLKIFQEYGEQLDISQSFAIKFNAEGKVYAIFANDLSSATQTQAKRMLEMFDDTSLAETVTVEYYQKIVIRGR